MKVRLWACIDQTIKKMETRQRKSGTQQSDRLNLRDSYQQDTSGGLSGTNRNSPRIHCNWLLWVELTKNVTGV